MATEAQAFGPSTAAEPDLIVSRWVDAFNARDLDDMLDCLVITVEFHPLRLAGPSASYRGHEGVRQWFLRLQHHRHEHRIELSETIWIGGDQVLATGSLRLDDEPGLAPFCGIHRLAGGRIAAMHHYLSDPEMIEQLGLIP